MEHGSAAAQRRIVGGNLALDYVNTRSGPPGGPCDDDVLCTYGDLVAWAHHVEVLTEPEATGLRKLAEANPGDALDTYRRALRLRDHLDAVFRNAATSSGPTGGQLARLRDEASHALAHAQIVPEHHTFRWHWSGHHNLERPLWPVSHAAAELLTSGPMARLKQCAGCSFLFLDESKNRSRRWCSMDDCGTAAKVRRYVARRAAARDTGTA